jgi:hypothetical protein
MPQVAICWTPTSCRLQDRVNMILDAIEVQAFDAPADIANARLRQALETLGTPIGSNDMLIGRVIAASEHVSCAGPLLNYDGALQSLPARVVIAA